MKLANYHEDKEQWLEERKSRIGASEVSAALGLNPYKSPFQLWAEKTGLLEAPELNTEAIRWGARLEAPIALGWSEETGKDVEQAGDLLAHSKHHWLVATPDYYVGESELLECKLSGSPQVAAQFKDGNTPDWFQTQCIIQLACTERDAAHIAALLSGTRLETRIVTRDAYVEELILGSLMQFWELVQKKTPPPLVDNDNDIMGELYPVDPHKEIELGCDATLLVDLYEEAKAKKKRAESEVSRLQAEIKMRLGGARTATAGAYRINLSEVKTSRLDTDRLRSERLAVYQEYLKPSSYQKMTVRKLNNKGE
jgi:putative phage-type endonuclease